MPDKSCLSCTKAQVYGELDHLLTCPCSGKIASGIPEAIKMAKACTEYDKLEKNHE